MTLKQLAGKCGKSPPFIMTVQKKFGLPAGKEYSDGYAALLSKLIYLQLASVSQKEIKALLTRERKLLELLKADSVTNSPVWFEDLCTMKAVRRNHPLKRPEKVWQKCGFSSSKSRVFHSFSFLLTSVHKRCNIQMVRDLLKQKVTD